MIRLTFRHLVLLAIFVFATLALKMPLFATVSLYVFPRLSSKNFKRSHLSNLTVVKKTSESYSSKRSTSSNFTQVEKSDRYSSAPLVSGVTDWNRVNGGLPRSNGGGPLSNVPCVPFGSFSRNGDFTSDQAEKVRQLYHLHKNQCLMPNINYNEILSTEDINAADGFPLQMWKLIKEPWVCPPKVLTGNKWDVSCRNSSNPVRYFWEGSYDGTESKSHEGCESTCVRTNKKEEADFLIGGSAQKGHLKSKTKKQYTVRYTVESQWAWLSADGFDISMDMSPFANVPMLFMPDNFYAKLLALPVPTMDDIKSRKLAVWAASNCYKTSWPRQAFAQALAKYMPVDFPGNCLHNVNGLSGRRSWVSNPGLYKKYMFVFAFSNSVDNVNIDEKFFLPLLGNSVPVAVVNDAVDWLSPGRRAYIDATKFQTPKALASHLLWLQKNPLEYIKLFDYRKEKSPPAGLPRMYDALANFEYMPRLKHKVMCRLCSCLCDSKCLAHRPSTDCGWSQNSTEGE
jgi:hypothetical protein